MKKTVLITGASRGIGKAIAKEYAKNNYNVVLNFNNTDVTDLALELKKQGVEVLPYRANISDNIEVTHMIDAALKIFGSIDVLINNAGIALPEKLLIDYSDDEIENLLNINLKSTILLTKKVLSDMIKKRRGKIINISSILGQVGCSCEVPYSASKAGIIGFTKALAKEVGEFGITVNSIAPGLIETDMTSSFSLEEKNIMINNTAIKRIGQPEDIAKIAYYLSTDDFITGEILGVNGGLTL